MYFQQPDKHMTPPSSVQLRVGLTADVVPGGKPGPRRTKPLVIVDAAGPTLHRKGDAMANQDTCLSALNGEIRPPSPLTPTTGQIHSVLSVFVLQC